MIGPEAFGLSLCYGAHARDAFHYGQAAHAEAHAAAQQLFKIVELLVNCFPGCPDNGMLSSAVMAPTTTQQIILIQTPNFRKDAGEKRIV